MQGNLGERDHLEDTGVDVSIIFRWILRKWDGVWTNLGQERAGGGLLWMR